MTIFFDMDGVLCDFVGGSLRAHGETLPIAEADWDFPKRIGFPLGAADPAFWEPLSNREFWAGLDPLPDGIDLFRRAFAAFGAGRIAILSSGVCPGSVDGKRDWLKRHLPEFDPRRAVFAHAKGLVAGPGKVLVDDHDKNVTEFIAAGGAAVLVPRPWNQGAGHADAAGRFDVAGAVACLRRVATASPQQGVTR